MADREQFEACSIVKWHPRAPKVGTTFLRYDETVKDGPRGYIATAVEYAWRIWQVARRQGREEMKRRALCAAQGVCMDVMAHPDVQAIMRGDMASAVKAACEAASMGVADRIEAKIRALPLDEEDGRD